ncbi:hypothetical protein MN205_09360, partial [Kineococcus sp. TRM81007]|nr:hypothetical protein [Kineococcus sp. TRM81007]
ALDAADARARHAALAAAEAELERAAGERARCTAERARCAAELAEAAAGAGGAGEEELRAARADRDAVLAPLRDGGALDTAAAAELLAAVARADTAADALLEHAEAAARLRQLRRDAERAEESERAAAAVEEAARRATGQARTALAQLFTDAGVRVPGPEGPASALAALELLGAERAAAAAADARAQELRADADAHLAQLGAVLERCGRGGTADAGLEPALEAARAVLAAADEAQVERALAAERQRAAEGAEQRHGRCAERAARAAGAFRDAAVAAGLPDGLGPAGWAARAQSLRVAAERAEAAAAALARAAAREEHVAAHARRVAAVAARLGVSCDADEPGSVAGVLAELAERLRTSRADEGTAAALEQQLAELAAERAGQEARREAAEAELAALRGPGEEPAALAERAARSRELLGERAVEEAELAVLAADAGSAAAAEALVREVGERTDADLRTDAEQLAAAAEAAHEASAQAQQAVGRAQTELERLTSGADANVLAARRAEALAGLHADTERYVQVDLQRTVLRRQLEEFSTARENPLLTEAGRVLSVLTAGRWTGLSAVDDGGSRRLAVRRGDGEVLEGVDGLSEGTADQVFLALRLAAIAAEHRLLVRAGRGPLPVVLDDVLMTFDEPRTGAALAALAELARDVQVVLLTHHADVAERAAGLAGNGHDVTVTRLPAPPAAGDLAVGATAPARPGKPSRGAGADPQLVRAWAREQGLPVADRGRVSEQLVLDYLAAHDLS